MLEAYVAGSSVEEPSLRNKLLSNLVNKRSESDGIVTLDRPKPEVAIRSVGRTGGLVPEYFQQDVGGLRSYSWSWW